MTSLKSCITGWPGAIWRTTVAPVRRLFVIVGGLELSDKRARPRHRTVASFFWNEAT
ncbi:hypothetical protein [Phyllobacterium sp. 22552]|uniref:hypothetical protein n=1 Tax=Phyllobacterium sp. 22552 TaxID=3453941 RepID=UPI003F834A92